MLIKKKIYVALREEKDQGWVWIKDSNLPPRSIIRICNPDTNQSIYCEALQIDDSFLNIYNDEKYHRIRIDDPSHVLVINGWYRKNLGDLQKNAEQSLYIEQCNCLCGHIRASLNHPQQAIRLATQLGVLGAILGVIGFFLGIIGLVK
jgi:hypothetical protein